MPLKTWWDDDANQRYWMEVATTGTMGTLLIAPKFPGSNWSYELVGQVRPGDRVLHWESGAGRRGLVGWSVVTAPPEVVAPVHVATPWHGWAVSLRPANHRRMDGDTGRAERLRRAIVDPRAAAAQAASTRGRLEYWRLRTANPPTSRSTCTADESSGHSRATL